MYQKNMQNPRMRFEYGQDQDDEAMVSYSILKSLQDGDDNFFTPTRQRRNVYGGPNIVGA